jgi:hypothetical protein
MRLQRDVAEVFEADHAERIRVMQDGRHRHRNLGQEFRDRHERHRRVIDRPGVQRQHDRPGILQQHAVVAAIGGVTGERHHFQRLIAQVLFGEVLL